MEAPKSNESKKGKGLIVLLIVSVVLNIYQWINHGAKMTTYEQRVDTLYVERTNIEKELTDARSELNKYWGINAGLDSLLKEANIKMDEQEKTILKIKKSEKNYAALSKKLKMQLSDLQGLRDEYLSRIDSLLIANKQLMTEKEELTGTVSSLSKNLQTTLSTASVVKAEYLVPKSFKRKNNGKFVETAMAKRTHKMEVCFDLLDNKISKTGDKNVYLKITEPGGKPIGNKSTGSASFKTASGEEVMYAATTTINYTGAKQNVCLSFEEKEDKLFPPGTYLIEVYVDGTLSGASSYVLK